MKRIHISPAWECIYKSELWLQMIQDVSVVLVLL